MRNMKILARFANAESLRLTNMLSANAGHAATDNEVETFARSIRTFCKDFEQTIVSTMRRQQTEQRLCSNMVDGFIDSVKSLLMHEFSSLFTLVPKLVRDLSRELKKEVNLEIFGGEIEIDRRILEELKDPLVHLIRNCLDHGIETPEERIGRGKSPGAILTVGARQIEGGTVQLVVGDDGQGIDIERLKLAAVREGVISPQEAQTMTDIESMELMCRLSVSTRETVTAISGRGIGMAIVRERIQNLGGRVFVQTKPGEGTKFILQLPTKLSTFRGIQVMAAEQTFIIPTLYVYYAGRTLRSDIKQSGSRNIVNINGQLTSVQSLADVLQIRTSKEIKTKANRSYQQLLVLEAGDRRAGFLVDEIMHEQEVLVRGLSYPLCRVSNISGATILGSGQVVPVLNIVDLLGTSSKAVWADEKLSRQLAEERRHWQKLSEEPIYLVYRHLTSLVMLKSLLENEGYVVKTFDSNEAAGKALANRVPLLLLKSAELPETPENGLMSTIRLDERLKDLPVIFFGSENKASGEQYAQQRGGYAYFSKLDFDRKQILQLIEKLTCART